MKHIIVVNDKEKAKEYIRHILDGVNYLDVTRFTESEDQILAKTVANEYEWVRGNLYYQGSVDVIHLGSEIGIDDLHKIYIPMLSNSQATQKIIYIDIEPKNNPVQDRYLQVIQKYNLPQHIKQEIFSAFSDIDNIMIEYFAERFGKVDIEEFIEQEESKKDIIEEEVDNEIEE